MHPSGKSQRMVIILIAIVLIIPLLEVFTPQGALTARERDILLYERNKSYSDAFNPVTKDVFLLIGEGSPAYNIAARFGHVEGWGIRIAPSSEIYPLFRGDDGSSVFQNLDQKENIVYFTLKNATIGRLYEVQYTLPETIPVVKVVSEHNLSFTMEREGDYVYVYARAENPVEPFASYNQGGYQDYYVIGDDWDDPSTPGNDELTMLMFRDWVAAAYGGSLPIPSSAHTVSVVSFVAYGTVKIYLDEVEDGYTFNESTFTGWNKVFLLHKGEVLTLTEYDKYAPGSIGISGQDRFFTAGAPVFMVHGAWPSAFGNNGNIPGVISAELWPQYPVLSQATSYVTPMGHGGGPDTDFTYLIVQAFNDGTVIKINDPNTPANPDYKGTLNRGEVYIYGHYAGGTLVRPSPGTTVSATAPVQAGLFTSGGQSIDTRYYMLMPQEELGSRYIVPVHSERNKDGQMDLARLFIYSFADQTIHIQDKNGVLNVALKGGQTYSSYTVPEGSAAYIYNDYPDNPNYKFWILGAFDSGSARDDWGFQPIDAGLLNKEYYIPYAPSPLDAQPLWISPVEDTTTIYVDFDNDGASDRTLLLNRLDVARVTDTYDQDNQGAHLWSDKPFAVSYGESGQSNPSTPNLDFGYTVLPFLLDWKNNFLAVNKSASPGYHSMLGQSSRFTITADAPRVDIFNVNVTDTMPPGWQYIPGSTYINFTYGGTNKSGQAAEPMVTGSTLLWSNTGTIRKGARLSITFLAKSTFSSSYGANVNTVLVEGYDIAGNIFDAQAQATVYIEPPPIRTKELYLQRTPLPVKAVDGTSTNNILNRSAPQGSTYSLPLSSPVYLYLYPELASDLSIFGYVNLTLYMQSSGQGIVEFNLYDLDSSGGRIPIARSFTTVSGSLRAYTMGVTNVYYTVAGHHALLLEVLTASGTYPTMYFGSQGNPSVLTINTYTYVKVELAETYRGSIKTEYFHRGETVKVYSRVSDPFGSYDISGATITIINPLGGVIVIDAPMTLSQIDPSTPSAWKDYTYTHLIKVSDPMGWYRFTVTGIEKNGVKHTLTSRFYVSYYGVIVEPDSVRYGSPGSTIDYPEYIMNIGQLQDRFSLILGSSTSGWGTTILISGSTVARDDNGDGKYEYVNPAWDSNGDSLPDVSLQPGENLSFTLRRSIPVSADMGDSDTVLITGQSHAEPAVQDNATIVTSVPAPPERVKELYLHSLSNSPDGKLDRISPAGSTTVTRTITEGSTYYWKLIPPLAEKVSIRSARARLHLDPSDPHPHKVTFQIYDSLIKAGETTVTAQAGAGWVEGQIQISYTFPSNSQIRLGVYFPDDNDGTQDHLDVRFDSASYPSRIELNTTTYINVRWVKTYDSSGSERNDFKQGEGVSIRAYVTDPFGDYDISSALVTIINPQGQVVVNNAPMSIYSSSPRIYQYTYQIPIGIFGGVFRVNVTAIEGNGVKDYGECVFTVAAGEMGLRKIGDKVYVVPGDRIQYTIYYNNTGSSSIPAVWLNDTLPPGVRFIGSSVPPSYIQGNDVRWGLSNVAPGAHFITVEVEVLSVPDGTLLTNTITLVFRDAGGKVHDPQSDIFTSIVRLTSIQGSKIVDKPLAYPNETVTYTIYYNNTGSYPASYLWVNDTIPEGTEYISSSIPYDSVSGRTYRWVLKGVTPGVHYFTLTVKVGSVKPTTPLTNTVTLAYTDVSGHIHTTSAQATLIVRGPLMSFKKVGEKGYAYPGDLINFTIWFNNSGNDPADVWLNDTLPSGMEYVTSSTPYQSRTGNTFIWRFTGVGVGVHALHLTVRITPGAIGTLVNHATLDPRDVKGNPCPRLNSSASVKVLVPVLELSKTGAPRATPYDVITYTLWYNNTGNANIKTLWLNDTLPPGCTYISSSIPINSSSGQVVTWVLSDVPPGPHAINVTVRLGNYPDTAQLTNNLSGTYFVGDTRYTKYAEHTMTVYAPHIVPSKIPDRIVATIGDVITYTLWYNNTGHDTSAIIWINDTLPPGTAYKGSSLPYDSVSGSTYHWVIKGVSPGVHLFTLSVTVLNTAQFNTWVVNTINGGYTDSTQDAIAWFNASCPVRIQAPIVLPAKQGYILNDHSTITYTIWYNNTGVQTAGRVWINDTLPAYLEFVSSTPPPSGISGNVVRWVFTNVGAGTHAITLHARVKPGTYAGTIIVNRVDVNYTDLNGDLMLPSSAVHRLIYPYGVQRFVFEKGTLVIPMDSMQGEGSHTDFFPAQIHAYGLVYWAVNAGVNVFWASNSSKTYQGRDFFALTDDDGNPGIQGNITLRGYAGGPFLIPDPAGNTSGNEAWSILKSIAIAKGFTDVRIHELQERLVLEPWDVYRIDRAPRIALRNESKSPGWTPPADQVPYLWNQSYTPSAKIPVTNLSDDEIRGGALITPSQPGCGLPNYDILLIGDDGFHSTKFTQSDTIFQRVHEFVTSSGHVNTQCAGATLATRIPGWFVRDGIILEENDIIRGDILYVNQTLAAHPILQTWGTPRANRGTFMAWDASNSWSTQTRSLLTFREDAPGDGTGEIWAYPDGYGPARDDISGGYEDDPAYIYSTDMLGIVSSFGGHIQGTDTPDGPMTSSVQPRLLLNSILYSVVTPRPVFEVTPKYADAGKYANITVDLGFDAGEFIPQGNLTLYLEKNVTLKGIEFLIPWGSSQIINEKEVRIGFSDLDPRFDHYLLRLNISVFVSSVPEAQPLLSVGGYILDLWNRYDMNVSGCIYILPRLHPTDETRDTFITGSSLSSSFRGDTETLPQDPEYIAQVSERRVW